TKRLGMWEIPGPRVAFTTSGEAVAWGFQGARMVVCDVATGKHTSTGAGHSTRIAALMFARDGKTLTSASHDGKICRWDTASGRELGHSMLPEDEPRRYGGQGFHTVGLSPDGRHIAAGSLIGNVTRLYDLVPSAQVVCDFASQYRGPGEGGLLFSPDGAMLAAGDSQGQYRLWSVQTGRELAQIKTTRPRIDRVGGIAFSQDSRFFALAHTYYTAGAGNQTAELHLVRAADGKEVVPPLALAKQLRGLAFSPDGKVIAAGTGNGIDFWEVATGKPQRSLPILGSNNVALAFSPDGRTIACSTVTTSPLGESQAAVLILERASGGIRARFTGQRGFIEHFPFSPDGQPLAPGRNDPTTLRRDSAGDFAS